MKIYKLTQNEASGYDTYDSVIVCAENEEKARKIHPNEDKKNPWEGYYWGEWVEFEEIDKIKVEYLGEAKEGMKEGVLLSSYNAG